MSLSEELDRWARAYRRLPAPEKPKPPTTPHARSNLGGRKSGERVQGWSEAGIKGVYPMPSGRHEAKVRTGGKLVRLGTFATANEAAEAVARHLREQREATRGLEL